MAVKQLQLASSSNVSAAEWNSDTMQLTVTFYSGGVGFYSGIGEQEALDFERAPSPGRYVHNYLAPRFPWTRIA